MIDDRHDLYGSDRFREYLILMQAESGWKDVLARWQIKTFVLPADSTLTSLLGQLPQEWSTVYQDKSAVVVEKKKIDGSSEGVARAQIVSLSANR
jgi:hypothetical protein